MWKPEHRHAADRTGLRYPSDLTDAEWVIVEPMIAPAKRGGRRRSVNVREVLNGIFYVLWTGCQWKALRFRPHQAPWRIGARYRESTSRRKRRGCASSLRSRIKRGGVCSDLATSHRAK